MPVFGFMCIANGLSYYQQIYYCCYGIHELNDITQFRNEQSEFLSKITSDQLTWWEQDALR